MIKINNIPAILYGDDSDKIYIYVHGKLSNKEEAENFASIVNTMGYQVLSFDLPEHGERKNDPYECTAENGVRDLDVIYSSIRDKYNTVSLYACSLGAYFSLVAFQDLKFENCLFVSPILNMEILIQNMMKWANVSENELREKKEIQTSFGEKLSWNYYQYVKEHPIERWNTKTHILYGEKDNLTEKTVIDSFSEKYKCTVTVMPHGEHFFHTPEQLEFMEKWIKEKF